MTVFHDYTQLIRISQRRITAAWHELANERVVVTPRVAREAAEGIIAWDLDRSIRRWQEDLQDPSPTVTDEQRMITRVKIWWATQWLQPSGVYELRVMNAQEQEHARRLVELIPRTGFTCHPSEVDRHPDTWIVCEALAAGGQLLITRNLGTTRRGVINGWVKTNQPSLGFRTDKLIISSDEWLKEKLGGLESEESRAAAAKLALAAFWPSEGNPGASEIVRQTADHAARLRHSPYGECMSEAEAALIQASQATARRWTEEVRARLPRQMHAAEQAHPRYQRGRGPG